MKKKYSLILLLFIIGFNLQAQKIDLKKGKVIALEGNDQVFNILKSSVKLLKTKTI